MQYFQGVLTDINSDVYKRQHCNSVLTIHVPAVSLPREMHIYSTQSSRNTNPNELHSIYLMSSVIRDIQLNTRHILQTERNASSKILILHVLYYGDHCSLYVRNLFTINEIYIRMNNSIRFNAHM